VLAGRDDAQGLGAPKRLLVVFGNAREHSFPGDSIADKNDAAFVPGYGDSAVRDVGYVKFELAPLHFTHAPSINRVTPPDVHWHTVGTSCPLT
jgi:hypothetical protein